MTRIFHNVRVFGGTTSFAFAGDTILPEAPTGAETIDGKGLHLAPGIVDLGVFAVDRAACRAGGITRVGLMPDQSPILDDPGIIRRAALMGKPDLWVHPLAAATQGLEGRDLAEMAINASAGARAVATGRRWIGVGCELGRGQRHFRASGA